MPPQSRTPSHSIDEVRKQEDLMFFPLMLAAVGRYKRLMAAGVNRRVIKTGEDVKTQRSDEAGGRGRGGRGRADGDGLTRAG